MINNVVIVAGGQQRNSAIDIHVSILPQIPLPSRLPRNTEQSSLCYTDHFEYSSVYMSIPNSLTIPSNHSSCPSNHKFVLMVHSVSQKLVIFIICVLGIMVQKAFLFFKTIPFLFVHYFNITFDEFMNE